MLEALHEKLYAIRWLVLVVALIPLFIYGRVLVRMLFAGAPGDTGPVGPPRPAMPPLRRALPAAQPQAPVAAPRPAAPAGVLDAGIAGHQQRGVAKTAKIPLTPSAPPAAPPRPAAPPAAKASEPLAPSTEDEQAMVGLFGAPKREVTSATATADQAAVKEKTGAQHRTASRLEQLGFHQGTDAGDAAKPIVPNAPPRTQTAELTNILERIDKFLAEDQPADAAAAPATPAARPPTTDAQAPADPGKKPPPLWARPDVMDEDVDVTGKEKPANPPTKDQGEGEGGIKGQQKLF